VTIGLVVDLFAGGGGASVGLEAALGRRVDIAINHDPVALAVHKANHPETEHLDADIWEVKPREATKGRPVDVLWASPDCTHFSVAKGDVPRSKEIRSLAWVVVEWAREVRPSVIFLENVQEFRGWGPLGPDGRPDKIRKGETFNEWKAALEALGYDVDFRVLDASLYGAPTRRRRLFLVARCDGQAIRWPEPTHGPGRLPVHTAAECIDWTIPCPSIFERKRPLAEKTLWRIAQGIRRFVLESPRPFVVGVGGRAGQSHPSAPEAPLGTVTAKNDRALVAPVLATIDQRGTKNAETSAEAPLPTTVTKNRHALVAPTLVQTGYGERPGQRPRYLDLHQPLGTMVNGQKHALVAAFLAKHFGGVVGQQLDLPTSTVTAKDHHSLVTASFGPARDHADDVRAFLVAYYGTAKDGQSLLEPLRTVTAKDRLGLVTVAGVDYQIVDIGMRMLEPHELLAAQFGRFAAAYDMSAARTKGDKVRLIGNSVCPEAAEALVAVNTEDDLRMAAGG
jgi:DNA (cytosine-5)-methyltransferase 1